MSTITKVALAGASGNLGPAILEQLLNAGFQVTVLTREGSTHTFPSSVKVAPVDYNSVASLTEALRGQDAVISTLASAAIHVQLGLVEAAGKAGVKRFLPSEFGSNTVNDKCSKLPCFKYKVVVQDALKKEVETSGMSYTLLCNGPFFDWGMMVGFVMNVKGKSIDLYDGGNRMFSTTTLATIGKAVVGILRHPEETKNRAVYVQDTATTLRQLLEKGKKAAGPDGWTENIVSLDEVVAAGWEELKKEVPNPASFALNFVKASIWGEGYGCHFEKLDNELLGIKEMSEEEVQGVVNRYVSSN
ncbi:predicted protein [Uncinocarpus reesii 1704]|uniref:NmrA-like domain-containing protein n=1 Tax=Uncinocarpus reesii (strain UAMH 1704) TaxID=336963 RepID=C4JFV8_UNCRE|nr:uncharacterized protein UREG_01038 [Uncinocarpus reesii 1704]EEP76189.1 predicted protein [Uncinocarpus reesii 1704]